jgi:nickel-dependent lactate racemase
MSIVQLKYGKTEIPFEYNENLFQVLGKQTSYAPLSDVEIGEKLDNPIDSKPLEEIIGNDETVLLVVPDATRQVGAGQTVNLLVRRLIANGVMPYNIRIIFAVGIHRPVTEKEKSEILTPFIVQRIKTLEHNSKNLADVVKLGKTKRGIPIELNKALKEHDRVVLIGGITFHYFAGFTGGRKSICPGLGSSRTISETHKLAFDFELKTRREGVGLGLLEGNAVHEEFMVIGEAINPSFCISTVTNNKNEIIDLVCGDWKTSHKHACEDYAEKNTLKIPEKRDLVIVSSGGFPYDINLIQAHKALEMASHACNEGGTIVFLAECSDGLGRSDFLNWFEAEDSRGLAEKLCETYQVNGQTAWSLLTKAERFNIQMITNLPENETRQMRMNPARDVAEAMSKVDKNSKGYILPLGSKFLISLL